MFQEDEVVNSCRVCRSPNQDGDFECLYVVQVIEESGVMQSHTWQLTNTGKLYEEMLGVEIDGSTMEIYPQYLCNSCDLQMRLFRKLIMRARRTLEELAKMYTASDKNDAFVEEKNENVTHVDLETRNSVILKEESVECDMSAIGNENGAIESLLAEASTNITEPEQYVYEDCQAVTYTPTTMEEVNYLQEYAPQVTLPTKADTNEALSELLAEATDSTDVQYYAEEPAGRAMDVQSAIEHVDIKETSDEKVVEFTPIFEENSIEESSDLKQEPVEFFDVHYLEDTSSTLPINALERPKVSGACNGGNIRRAYECQACGLEFLRRTDFLQHRKTVHHNKFPCPYCTKLLHTNDALRVHLRLHSGEPAFKCDICQRTFNQKVHYRYHMDRHNNVRNFKCTECEKAFLSKHDLTVHMRSHTGERPFECEICGKDFLILQHLKMHRYSHTTKSFECHECKQKFISPSTLRIHLHTIHTSERRFQCEFCVKRFRRKHHLIAHYKVHQKSEANANEYDDLVEESEEDMEENDYQMVSDVNGQHLAMQQGVSEFLEINEEGHIDSILVVDDVHSDEQALYGTDYEIGVAEENDNLTF
ncbi:PREDICTED: zinc finger protein 19-like [Bactrocera latifrons]|nr:PREDICTED: zinc finger protein 19-like [Bactrocera latifrons]